MDSSLPFSIRDYRPDDFETLWQIDQQCFPPGISYTRHELSTYVRRRHAFALVATNETGHIIGFLVGEASRRREGHIITIDVVAAARQQRIGSALLENAEQRLRTSGCKIVYLETAVDNAAALAFYKRHSYEIIETVPRYYSNGVDALLLEKHLPQPSPSR
jgi:[ribosomal protein S18]-alanine N-acetyltransferase